VPFTVGPPGQSVVGEALPFAIDSCPDLNPGADLDRVLHLPVRVCSWFAVRTDFFIFPRKTGCPAWIRTMTKSSKDSCATITPPDKTLKTSLGGLAAQKKNGVCETHNRAQLKSEREPARRPAAARSRRRIWKSNLTRSRDQRAEKQAQAAPAVQAGVS